MDAPPVEHYQEPASWADMIQRCAALGRDAHQPCYTFLNDGEICIALLKPGSRALDVWHCYPHLQVKSDYI